MPWVENLFLIKVRLKIFFLELVQIKFWPAFLHEYN